MPDPLLSICVPSRNRQACFQQTIIDLLNNQRPDIEFVFADNSDDPSIMNRFMAGIVDPRVTYLPSGSQVFSMMSNWERTVDGSTGQWVTIIGDDDYVDPDLVALIAAIIDRLPSIEAIAWNRATYEWPEARFEEKSVPVSLRHRVMKHPPDAIRDLLFRWKGASFLPNCPYGIYHAAVSRETIKRIRSRFSGLCFEHPVVDYDFSHKLLSIAETLVYIDRPISVLGVSGLSNSAAVGNSESALRVQRTYIEENGNRFDEETRNAGFPFAGGVSVVASIMAAQYWFKHKYNIEIEGWEDNFVRCMVNEGDHWHERDGFERRVAICKEAFRTWRNGHFLAAYQPEFRESRGCMALAGLDQHTLRINQAVDGISTPAAFHALLKQVLPDQETLEFQF